MLTSAVTWWPCGQPQLLLMIHNRPRGLESETVTKKLSALFRVMNQHVSNLPPMPDVLPDYPAPVVRNGAEQELTLVLILRNVV
jgi:hypothetical protein